MALGSSDILLVAAIAAALGLGGFFISKLINLLQVIFHNIYYVGLVALPLIVGSYILIQLVNENRLDLAEAGTGFIVLLAATLVVPYAGLQVSHAATSYSADFTVHTNQVTSLNRLKYSSFKVHNVKRKGPSIFNGVNTACLVGQFCGEWTVNIQVSCNNGRYTQSATLSGAGGQSATKTVSGLPANSQCKAVASMTRPGNPTGSNPKTRYFTTGK